MNRRQFFGTLGIPTIGLSFIKLLGLSKKPTKKYLSCDVETITGVTSGATGQVLIYNSGKASWINFHY